MRGAGPDGSESGGCVKLIGPLLILSGAVIKDKQIGRFGVINFREPDPSEIKDGG